MELLLAFEIGAERSEVRTVLHPRLVDDPAAGVRARDDHVGALDRGANVGRPDEPEMRVARPQFREEPVDGLLRAAPDPHLAPGEDGVAGGERALADAARAEDREDARVGSCEPLRRDRGGRSRPHERVVRPVADREREPRLGVRVDEDREDGRQIEAGVVLTDRDPLAGRCLRLLDPGGHDLPLAAVAVEHDVALGLHVDAPEAVHAKGMLDAVDVLGGGEQADHVRAAEDERLTVPPALHRPILCPARRGR